MTSWSKKWLPRRCSDRRTCTLVLQDYDFFEGGHRSPDGGFPRLSYQVKWETQSCKGLGVHCNLALKFKGQPVFGVGDRTFVKMVFGRLARRWRKTGRPVLIAFDPPRGFFLNQRVSYCALIVACSSMKSIFNVGRNRIQRGIFLFFNFAFFIWSMSCLCTFRHRQECPHLISIKFLNELETNMRVLAYWDCQGRREMDLAFIESPHAGEKLFCEMLGSLFCV